MAMGTDLAFCTSTPRSTTMIPAFAPSLALSVRSLTTPSTLPLVQRRYRHASRTARASVTDPSVAPAAEAGAVRTSDSLGALRIGHGYDLHRLEAGYPLILGGEKLEHTVGCAAHSDGDAVYHCVVDAVLGALALPDIGQLFPDSDPRFKNCSSDVFMTAAYARMKLAGFRIGNLDVTVILERPKLSPHKDRIRQNIAELLCTDLANVNLKAKTHEKVDAVGENRAVEVHAVVVLVKDGPGFPPAGDAPAKAAEQMARAEGTNAATELLKFAQNRSQKITEATFGVSNGSGAIERLYGTVNERRGADPGSSWTAKLFSKGRHKIAQKVGEEAVEVVIDAVEGNKACVVSESADLLYHLCVLWADMGILPGDVWDELRRREGTSGVVEKQSRNT